MIANQPSRRAFLGGAAAMAGVTAVGCSGEATAAPPAPVFDASDFGAAPGASAAQNTRAFAAASAALNRAGGGTLVVRPGTYSVGVPTVGKARPGRPPDIILIENCSRPVSLIGEGVTLRAAPGLRLGSFDPRTGRRYDPPSLPFLDFAYRVDAYIMILVRGCRAPVDVSGFDLDGNLRALEIGGQWDDRGVQATAMGLLLESNTGSVTVRNLNSHHHGQDGVLVMHAPVKDDTPRYPVRLEDVVCDLNARQGLSWIGGTELTAVRCRFTRSGRSGLVNPPSAGVDIEPAASACRNGRFIECEFADNAGVGFLVVTGGGPVRDIRLERCRFVGTTDWSIWPRAPGIVFEDCEFVGSIVNVHGDPDPRQATRFTRCRFEGDRRRSPTGQVFGQYLMDLGGGCTNVLMDRCRMNAVDPAIALAWTNTDMRFSDCVMTQAGAGQSYPRGVYSGNNSIRSNGPVGLDGSRFLDPILLNGNRFG